MGVSNATIHPQQIVPQIKAQQINNSYEYQNVIGSLFNKVVSEPLFLIQLLSDLQLSLLAIYLVKLQKRMIY